MSVFSRPSTPVQGICDHESYNQLERQGRERLGSSFTTQGCRDSASTEFSETSSPVESIHASVASTGSGSGQNSIAPGPMMLEPFRRRRPVDPLTEQDVQEWQAYLLAEECEWYRSGHIIFRRVLAY